MVDPQNLKAVKHEPRATVTQHRNRVPKLSTTNRSHSVKYEPDSQRSNGGQNAGQLVGPAKGTGRSGGSIMASEQHFHGGEGGI